MSSGNNEEPGQELGQEPKLEEPKLEEPKLEEPKLEEPKPPPPFTRLGSLRENAQTAVHSSFITADEVGILNQRRYKIQKRYEKYNQHFLNIQNAMKEIEHELDELHKEIDGILPEPSQVETSGSKLNNLAESISLETASKAESPSESNDLAKTSDTESETESDIESDTESDTESESPYTKKYSSKLQYPTTELALKFEDYIESNPEIHDFTLIYCCYSINTDYMIPFVVYSGKESDGKYQFPSVPVMVTEDTDIESYKNTIKDGMFTGYIPDATNPSVIYMFYSVLTPKLLPGKEATINELCHLKTVDGIGIHESIDKLFTQNGDLIYITELETSEHIPVPFSGYLCTMDAANHITNVVRLCTFKSPTLSADMTEQDVAYCASTMSNVVNQDDEEEDIQLFTTDIFNVGLQDDFYYLTTKSLNPGALRYVIFPLKAVNFDKSIMDYSEYNSVYYNSPEIEFWAVTSIKQIGKI
jgi:hypothetical protein